MFEDKNLTCKDCGAEFVFSASEQEFYAEKGFANEPGRCPTCRAARKQQNRGGGFGRGSRPQREMHETTCSACGVTTQVPFRPSGDRPVYCSDCFSKNRGY
ncbi:zinc-ribbon domain containing protein [Phosphitispora fastidiosa]|uniref:zinc-ribbon domain containing protein n=1 Tax=Phosphitispora fastidiosa TaxID=2837202 RepID=UPI001E283EE3|nr:zinc-ribbon domain containing protein [Phosphitispora fastidiosa]MBU7006931.1 CxxC-x17-CxxC domain-containing protein [Phosphitispora fastidiosa]